MFIVLVFCNTHVIYISFGFYFLYPVTRFLFICMILFGIFEVLDPCRCSYIFRYCLSALYVQHMHWCKTWLMCGVQSEYRTRHNMHLTHPPALVDWQLAVQCWAFRLSESKIALILFCFWFGFTWCRLTWHGVLFRMFPQLPP